MTSTPRASNSRRIIILGSTGSIGVNTVAVIEHLAADDAFNFEIVGLAAGSNAGQLREQACRTGVKHIAIADRDQAAGLALPGVRVFSGPEAAVELIDAVAKPGDLVVCAMVGAAGIPATLAAIERGCDIALANKETLVAAGELVMPLAAKHRVNLLPIDSEHSAIFQCLEAEKAKVESRKSKAERSDRLSTFDFQLSTLLRRIVITASGGPFRTWSRERIEHATVAEALNHPTWNMGPKITIDSATMMNKGLEIIEAHWLFGLPAEKIDVIIHPQSIVHSMVEFIDGSVIAQLGPPDMRTPIQYALTWPQRAGGISKSMEWSRLRSLAFEPLDDERFPAPAMAKQVVERGGSAGAIFNAANEAAVAAFLAGEIAFGRITELVHEAMDEVEAVPVHTMQDVIDADLAARQFVVRRMEKIETRKLKVES